MTVYYLALFNDIGIISGPPLQEVEAGDYARKPLILDDNGVLLGDLIWPKLINPWGTITYGALMPTLEGGAVEVYGRVFPPKSTRIGSVLSIKAGDLYALIAASNSDQINTITMIAATALSGQRVVIFGADGAQYADPNNLDHASQSPGLTMHAADAGAAVSIKTAGNISDPGFTWEPGTALYLGESGRLVAQVPTSGLMWKLASVNAAGIIYFEPDDPIWRG